MRPDSIRRPAYYVVPALALFLVFQACGGSDDASAQQAADPLEGVWEAVITARDCTTGAATGTFRAADVFHRGGTVTDTSAAPTATRGPAFGTWGGASPNYTARLRGYTYDATGALTGTIRFTRTITLSADGNTLTSVNTTTNEDPTGATVRSGCATDVSTRAR